MKLSYITPLVISNCVEYLKTRPVGTTYHPRENQFVLDGKIMAKIIRHDGKLSSSVDGMEIQFFNRILKHALNGDGLIFSILSRERFIISEFKKYNRFAVSAELVKQRRILRGGRPQFLNVPDEVYEKKYVKETD